MSDARSLLAQALAEAQSSLEAVDTAALDVAAQLIASSPRCFAAGQGRSGHVARMFAMRLAQLGRRAHAVGESTTPAIAAGDLLVACSGSGETHTTCYQAQKARDLGATVMAATGRPDSSLAALANHVVRIPTAESEQLGASRYEHVLLMVLDTLAARVAAILDIPADEIWRRHANLE
jgi:6-phospho-3-hexuloisomerase